MKVAANETIRAVEIQSFRTLNRLPEDELGFFDHERYRQDVDLSLLIFALWRLSEIARLTTAGAVTVDANAAGSLRQARARFHRRLVSVTVLRNVVVHLADYAAGVGWNQPIPPGALFSGAYTDSVRPIAGNRININVARIEANTLYAAVNETIEAIAR